MRAMRSLEYVVDLMWNTDAAVWTATSEFIPGLALESNSLDALIARVRHIVPELLESSRIPAKTFSLRLRSERTDSVRL